MCLCISLKMDQLWYWLISTGTSGSFLVVLTEKTLIKYYNQKDEKERTKMISL